MGKHLSRVAVITSWKSMKCTHKCNELMCTAILGLGLEEPDRRWFIYILQFVSFKWYLIYGTEASRSVCESGETNAHTRHAIDIVDDPFTINGNCSLGGDWRRWQKKCGQKDAIERSCNWKMNGYHVLIRIIRKIVIQLMVAQCCGRHRRRAQFMIYLSVNFRESVYIAIRFGVDFLFVRFGFHWFTWTANARIVLICRTYFLREFVVCFLIRHQRKVNQKKASPKGEQNSHSINLRISFLTWQRRQTPKKFAMNWVTPWLGSDKIEIINFHCPGADGLQN